MGLKIHLVQPLYFTISKLRPESSPGLPNQVHGIVYHLTEEELGIVTESPDFESNALTAMSSVNLKNQYTLSINSPSSSFPLFPPHLLFPFLLPLLFTLVKKKKTSVNKSPVTDSDSLFCIIRLYLHILCSASIFQLGQSNLVCLCYFKID